MDPNNSNWLANPLISLILRGVGVVIGIVFVIALCENFGQDSDTISTTSNTRRRRNAAGRQSAN